jgi:hypothetical protein
MVFLLISINLVIIPVVNGLLSHHDTQLLLLNNLEIQNSKSCYTKRQINRANIENFTFNLSFETWDEVFSDGEVDKIFSSFLNTYLRVFNNRFPVRKIFLNHNNRAWLTVCFCKRPQGNLLCGRASYLNNRYQRVVIKINYLLTVSQSGNKLDLEFLKGRFLDHCFFLLYINDLPAVISDILKPTLILTTSDFMQLKKISILFLGR